MSEESVDFGLGKERRGGRRRIIADGQLSSGEEARRKRNGAVGVNGLLGGW